MLAAGTRGPAFSVCSLLEVDVAFVPYSRHMSRITHGHAAIFLMTVNFFMRRIHMVLGAFNAASHLAYSLVIL
jgi:hypothetical protein